MPSHTIGYDEFGVWYDGHRAAVLEPALANAATSLDQALSELLSERDRARIRSTSGRVKSKRRTWRKINQARYADRVTRLDDIPHVVDDLIGLRVTCINVRDIEMIQSAIDALPRSAGPSLWVEPSSKRDYVSAPKDSGYRGWHVNLGTTVGKVPVVCELQVRTLLQDGWGELTHADTYSKDGALPPLVDVLSKRMADLLSILDDIAEDLRTELDRIDQAVVAEHDDPPQITDDDVAGQAADAARLLRSRWTSMDRPTDLASLAWALQNEFGAEVSDDWFGHRGFKRFLRHAIPEGEISTGRHAYLLPSNDPPKQAEGASSGDTTERTATPGAARQMQRIDPEFPVLDTWPDVFKYIAEAWRRRRPSDATPATIDRLTRSATDMARDANSPISRRHMHYVIESILTSAGDIVHESRAPSAAALAQVFVDQTLERMTELRVIDDTASKAALRVERWILAGLEP